MPQAVSLRPLAVKARVQSQAVHVTTL